MNRQIFFETVIAETENAEVRDFATKELDKLAKENSRKAEKRAEKLAEDKPLLDKIIEFLTPSTEGAKKVCLTSEVADNVGISTQKATPLLKRLVADGLVEMSDEKIKGQGLKKVWSLV